MRLFFFSKSAASWYISLLMMAGQDISTHSDLGRIDFFSFFAPVMIC